MRTTHTPLTTADAEAKVTAAVAEFARQARLHNLPATADKVERYCDLARTASPGAGQRADAYAMLGIVANAYRTNYWVGRYAVVVGNATRDAVSANRR